MAAVATGVVAIKKAVLLADEIGGVKTSVVAILLEKIIAVRLKVE
jgi:hypothetical protein